MWDRSCIRHTLEMIQVLRCGRCKTWLLNTKFVMIQPEPWAASHNRMSTKCLYGCGCDRHGGGRGEWTGKLRAEGQQVHLNTHNECTAHSHVRCQTLWKCSLWMQSEEMPLLQPGSRTDSFVTKGGALTKAPILCQPTTLLCGNPEKGVKRKWGIDRGVKKRRHQLEGHNGKMSLQRKWHDEIIKYKLPFVKKYGLRKGK